MSQIFNLYRLQQLDSQLDTALTKLSEFEQLLQNDDEVRESQKNYDQQQEQLRSLNQSLSKIEHEVKQQNIKIEQSESTLYGGKVKNPKELKDLENEVASLKKYLRVLEERELEALIAVEEQTKITEQAQIQLKQVIQTYEVKNADCIREIEQLRKEIAQLENEKQILIQGIPKDYFDRYQQIRQLKKGIAVTRIIDKSCAACGTTLTGGLIQDSRLPDKIVLCPSCGRILYGG
jgi:hypothetical protein